MAKQIPASVSSTALSYIPPSLLEDVHVVDLLELSPSQHAAARFLNLHQSTVSRSLRRLQDELEIESLQRATPCRYGRNLCLDYLRLACRAHRVMKGILRIASDTLHQSLLTRHRSVQSPPPQFRRVDRWADLIRFALLDGAIVSSLALDGMTQLSEHSALSGIRCELLGMMPIHLFASSAQINGVLLPHRLCCPDLHHALLCDGHRVVAQPRAAQEPAAWLKNMRDRDLALPLPAGLVGQRWLESNRLQLIADQQPLVEKLWLLLPADLDLPPDGQQMLRVVQRRVKRASLGMDLHGVQGPPLPQV